MSADKNTTRIAQPGTNSGTRTTSTAGSPSPNFLRERRYAAHVASAKTTTVSAVPGNLLLALIGVGIMATSGVGPVSVGLLFLAAVRLALEHSAGRLLAQQNKLADAKRAFGDGQEERAEAMLAAHDRTLGSGPLRDRVYLLRALMALARGDAKRAHELADAGLSVKPAARFRLLAPGVAAQATDALLGCRALASALLGHTDDATRDARRALSGPSIDPESGARARLALALVAKHAGDSEGLERVLREQARIMDCLPPSDRRLARGLLRATSLCAHSVYRASADQVAATEAQTADQWLHRIVPGLGEALPSSSGTQVDREPSTGDIGPIAGIDEARARALAEAPAPPAVAAPKTKPLRGFLQSLLLLALIMLILFLKDRFSAAEGSAYQSLSSASLIMRCMPGLLPGGLLLGVSAWRIRATVATSMGFVPVENLFFVAGKDEEALAELLHWERARGTPTLKVALYRSLFLKAQGRFRQALSAVDQGLALARARGTTDEAQEESALLLRRALLHAALHREEPNGEHLEHAYASLLELRRLELRRKDGLHESPRHYEFRIALAIALAQGNEARAAELARTRSATLSLSYADELLCEALIFLSDPETPVAYKTVLAEEFASNSDGALWVDTIAPGLRARLGDGPLLRVRATQDGEAQSEPLGDNGDFSDDVARERA